MLSVAEEKKAHDTIIYVFFANFKINIMINAFKSKSKCEIIKHFFETITP